MFILGAIVIIVTLLYLFGTKSFGYWAKKGVKHDKPIPFFGNMFPIISRSKNDTMTYCSIYDRYKNERFVGFYKTLTPTLVLRDPELIRCVVSTDFNHFYSRAVLPVEKYHDALLKNLFFADGDFWKLLRQRMTPAFTSGKLKAMFPLIVEKAENLKVCAENYAISGKEVDVRDLMARFTTDFIGAVAFGVKSDSLKDENDPFRQLGKFMLKLTLRDIVVVFLKTLFPKAFEYASFLNPVIKEEIADILRTNLKERNYKPSSRNDFIDQLIELKEKGKIIVESMEMKNPDGTPKSVEMELDEDIMIGQMFIFFAAGFETSSSATSFLLHQLAFHPEEQLKCQKEIDEVLSRFDNKLCYDSVLEMKYLQLAFKEGLRMWPSVGVLQRRCDVPYRLPGTDITIDKGVDIIIPVASLHNDKIHFKNPEQFVPERFLPENATFHKYAYLPFGHGPRACIGERLGLMQSVAGLAALLSKFSVEPSESTIRDLVLDPKSNTIQAVKGGIPLRIVERRKS